MIFTQFAVNFFVIIALSSSSWGNRANFGCAVSAQIHEEDARIYLSKEEESFVSEDGLDISRERKLSKKNASMPLKPPKPPTPIPPTSGPLDVFKKIDPKEFEWINKNNIVAGKTTCGFLKPDLGSDTDTIIYPKIKVYMCVRFAKNQPASKGNMVVHCGGPSSLSDCITDKNMGGVKALGQDNSDNYNIISIHQRGMGRSSPSFVHQECVETNISLEAAYTSDIVQNILDAQKKVVSACWSCEECGFRMKGTRKEDNAEIPLHFLEYSGTRQLAEDLLRFSDLIHSEKLSLYGISYGTNVMGTFATIFPSRVDKFVIDSNMQPESQLLPFAYGKAAGMNMRTDYMIYTCSAARVKDPKLCPIEDLRKCLTSVENMYTDTGLMEFTETIYPFIDSSSPEDMKLVTDLCEKASKNDENGVIDVLCSMDIQFCNDWGDESRAESINCDDNDGPTSGNGNCFAVSADNYKAFSGGPYSPTLMVNGMDYAGGQSSYNDKFFIRKVMDFQDLQGDMTELFIHMLLSNYNWPKNIPLPIRGSPSITGIVSGQIFDRLTEYEWTQKMRANFPATHLLTSQSNKHGLTSDPVCQSHIIKYFETGSVGFVDGNVCGDPSDAYHNFVR